MTEKPLDKKQINQTTMQTNNTCSAASGSAIPLVSIVVPVYNVEQYIEQCLDSILSQSYRNIEVIIINDGATDSCPFICEKYTQKDARIKLFNQENKGLSAAVTSGIERATGIYTCFVDSDDYIDSTMVEKLVYHAINNNSDIVQCNYFKVYQTGEFKKETLCSKITNFTNQEIENKVPIILLNNFEHKKTRIANCRWNKLVKTNILKANLPSVNHKIKMGEDLNRMFPVILDCKTITLIPDFLYFYRQNNTQMTKKYLPTMQQDYHNLYSALIETAQSKGILNALKKPIAKRKYIFDLKIIQNICRSKISKKEKKQIIKNIHKQMSKDCPKPFGFKRGICFFLLKTLLSLRLYSLLLFFSPILSKA